MRREAKLGGAFFLVLGFGGVWAGTDLLLGGSLPNDGRGCKMICGLTRLAAQLFGAGAGVVTEGVLWIVAGLAFAIFGYRLLRGR